MTLQIVDTHAILEKMLLDYFVERRRGLLAELKAVEAQLEVLRGGQSANADRKQQRAVSPAGAIIRNGDR